MQGGPDPPATGGTGNPTPMPVPSKNTGRPMLDDDSAAPRPVRRVSPVARALRPVQLRIGILQEQIAFLIARNLYVMRKPGDHAEEPNITGKRAELAEALAELDEVVASLPEKLRADGRVSDTRAAIARLDKALDILSPEPGQ